MIGRFRLGDEIFYGEIENGNVYPKGGVLTGVFNLSELRVLPPAPPSKIVCVGLNYRDHDNVMWGVSPYIQVGSGSNTLGPSDHNVDNWVSKGYGYGSISN